MTQDAAETLSVELQEAARKREAELQAALKAGTNLPELIERLCPDGVEYKILREIASTVPGLSGKTKEDFVDGNARFISYRNIFNNPAVDQGLDDFVHVGDSEKQNTIALGDVLVTGSSESREELGMTAVVTFAPAEKIYLNSFSFILRFDDSRLFTPGFLKHLFRSAEMRKQIQSTGAGVTRINLSKPKFLKIRVPVPPVEVQEEIVRILDMMTELEAELEAELEKRRLQYAHYRDALLSFNSLTNFEREREREPLSDQWRWATLGEISTLVKQRCNAESLSSENYTGMENLLPDMKGRVNAASIPAGTVTEVFPNDILVGNIRPYLKKIWFANRLGGASPDVLVLRVTQEKSVYSKYLYRVLCSEVFFSFYSSTARGGKMPRGDKKRILDFRFPLPSVAAQKEIVDILDQMDALVNDLTSGLPAEMEARRKQYAYYRDRLLTFKEKPQM